MSMKRVGSGLLVLSFLVVLLAPSVALAQAYRWVDEQGKVHYSEGLDSVPSQYRATATPIAFPKAPPPPPPPAPEKIDAEKGPAEQPGQPEKPKE
jgi:hypothetical protein